MTSILREQYNKVLDEIKAGDTTTERLMALYALRDQLYDCIVKAARLNL